MYRCLCVKTGKGLGLLLLLLLFATTAWGQGSGELTGVVTDPTGAVLPKITVKLTNASTGIVRTTETTAAGIYRFSALPVVGTYTISVDAKGFRPVVMTEVVISVGTTVSKDLQLEVGTISEVVNVEGGVQVVQTSESQVSDLVDQRVWQQMPLETRNQNEFINLVAGVVPQDVIGNGNRGAAVNGTRTGSGNFLVEGADNNDQGQGGRGQISDASGGAVTGISPEAIQEYRVITNSFQAEYGKAGGFVTDTVLKSGTNQFHGAAFEYNRTQALAANNFFSNRTIDPLTGKTMKDFVLRNQFGGSFGGPIVKDRTFFYGSVEHHRRRDRYPTSSVSVTPEFLDWANSGAFKTWAETDPYGPCMIWTEATCPGAFAHANNVGPLFNTLTAKSPFPLAQENWAPNGTNTDGTPYWRGAGYWTRVRNSTLGMPSARYPVPVYGNVTVRDGYYLDETKFSTKFDHRFTNNDQFSASYLFDDGTQTWLYGGGDGLIGVPQVSPGRSQNLALTLNHTFSPTVLNSFKASYLRHVANYPVGDEYKGMPSIYTWYDPIGVSIGASANEPQFFTDNQFQFQDHLSFVKGKHSFKTGLEYRRTRNGSEFMSFYYGEFTPYGVEDLITDGYFSDEFDQMMLARDPAWKRRGSWREAVTSINPTTGGRPDYYRGFRANEFAAYFQDDWKINNRLTMNWGLRWEYFGPPHNFKPGVDSNFYFGTAVTPIPNRGNPYMPVNNPLAAMIYTGQFMQRDHEIWNKDTNNFGPRLGFAWDVFGTQKFVVRAGAGIMYDRIWNNLFENIRFNAPFYSNAMLGYSPSGIPAGAIWTPGLYTDNFGDSQIGAFADASPLPSARHMDQNLVTPYYEQYHLGFQYEFRKGYVMETEYVGTMGHKLTGVYNINTYPGRYAADATPAINPSMSADNYRSNAFSSNYHGMQFVVKKTYSKGLQFNSSYTWSKTLDQMSDAFYARGGQAPTSSWDLKLDYGPADFDIRNRWVTSLSYDLPFMRQNRWIGGWSLNTIMTMQTGVGLSPMDLGFDGNADGVYNDRYTFIGTGSPNNSRTGGSPADGYFDVSQWVPFECPAAINSGDWCNGGWGRNALRAPGLWNQDLGISKKFKFTERLGLTLQGNLFNIWNRANFARPIVDASSDNFGSSVATVGNARVTQLAIRLEF